MLLDPMLILADLTLSERLDAMQGGFQWNTAEVRTFVAATFVVVGIGGLLAMLVQMLQRDRRGGTGARGTYLRQAISVLALSRSEADDLHLIASRSKLPHPVTMLLTPANMAAALDAAMHVRHDAALRKRMERLGEKLFGVKLPDVRHPTPPTGQAPARAVS